MSKRVATTPHRDGTRWLIAAYAGLAGFLALEASTRERGAASDLVSSRDDQGTTRMIVAAFAGSALVAPVLRRLPGPRLPRAAGPVGLALEATGLGLRAWSMRALASSYTRTLRTGRAQELVERGPYRLVRHPGYLGTLVTRLGFGAASRSPSVLVVVAALLGSAYRRRIAAEETLLGRDLPGYPSYARRTKRLVPFVW